MNAPSVSRRSSLDLVQAAECVEAQEQCGAMLSSMDGPCDSRAMVTMTHWIMRERQPVLAPQSSLSPVGASVNVWEVRFMFARHKIPVKVQGV
jgi:hypothetical protein